VNFLAKNEQIDLCREGATLTFRNANANVWKEHLRIEVDKWAKVEPSKEHVDSVNTANNLSKIEYELVPVK
jgi:replication factor A1